MTKYDAYDNELTRYIDMLMDISIKDIIGDLVGDILYADIPIDIPEGNITITGATPTGPFEITITKIVDEEDSKKPTKTNIDIVLQKGDSIYEEYAFEFGENPSTIEVPGFILEERDKGVIVMRNTREYACSNRAFSLINMCEKRISFSYEGLRDIDVEFENSSEYSSLKDKHNFLEQLMIGYLIDVDEGISICKGTKLHMVYQDYSTLGNKHPKIDINDVPKESLYEAIKGNKILERIDDLMHGNITHQSLIDLKTLLNTPNMEFGDNTDSFNHIVKVITQDHNGFYETLESIEELALGKSKNILSREYYEYLKELVLDTFQVEIPENLENPNEIVQLLKTNNDNK